MVINNRSSDAIIPMHRSSLGDQQTPGPFLMPLICSLLRFMNKAKAAIHLLLQSPCSFSPTRVIIIIVVIIFMNIIIIIVMLVRRIKKHLVTLDKKWRSRNAQRRTNNEEKIWIVMGESNLGLSEIFFTGDPVWFLSSYWSVRRGKLN